jgi:hypothetical protein
MKFSKGWHISEKRTRTLPGSQNQENPRTQIRTQISHTSQTRTSLRSALQDTPDLHDQVPVPGHVLVIERGAPYGVWLCELLRQPPKNAFQSQLPVQVPMNEPISFAISGCTGSNTNNRSCHELLHRQQLTPDVLSTALAAYLI